MVGRVLVSCVPLLLVAACGAGPTVPAQQPSPSPAGGPVATSGDRNPAPRTDVPTAGMPTTGCDDLRGGAEAAGLYDRACDGGDAKGCHYAALYFMCGAGVPRDIARSADRSERACDKGAMDSCGNAGVIVTQPDGATPEQLARALAALRKGCDGGDNASCNNLAIAELGGVGTPQDPKAALGLFEKLCNRGNLPSCGNAALFYITGAGGVTKDVDKGVSIAKPACENGEPVSCNDLGFVYVSDDAHPENKAVAAALFRRSCDAGYPAACDNLGQCYANGTGLDRDVQRARQLFKAACDGGNAPACTHLAGLVSMLDPGQQPTVRVTETPID